MVVLSDLKIFNLVLNSPFSEKYSLRTRRQVELHLNDLLMGNNSFSKQRYFGTDVKDRDLLIDFCFFYASAKNLRRAMIFQIFK
ncbi:hypothetical protein IKQ21_02205 [bacterium]|nr:hypothetical protein [bacterium]